ncbi:EpsD family peptidyl-prolyl cis-trans isomerase [Derxia gummosa]|uniref:peptidylprolyl isomerase n=1 Tax=Derxia gummosa DSM 723 TaxID=1121388 RepID=A0A8B6X8Z9_9BURK|nr:EpsD family peptidyl-prolyl cis-trans isomerase [Derxia gummosa]
MRRIVRPTLIAVALAGLLAGCGGSSADKAPTQTAARVNDSEISVHQINDVLAAQAGRIPPDQTGVAARRVLDGLVTQELLVQRARKAKLDDDPRVLRAVEAAKRQILASAYLEQRRALEHKPDDAEVSAFYDKNPAVFRDRRIYALDEFTIEPAPGLGEALDAFVARKPAAGAIADWLSARGTPFALRSAKRPAEQLPAAMLNRLKDMPAGESQVFSNPRALVVLRLTGATPAPVSLDLARPAIEQLLLRERVARVEQQEVRALRDGAKIEFMGEFADMGRRPPGVDGAPGAAPGGAATPSLGGASEMPTGFGATPGEAGGAAGGLGAAPGGTGAGMPAAPLAPTGAMPAMPPAPGTMPPAAQPGPRP